MVITPGPDVLVILDGASEPVREGVATSLERAVTPTLDALAAAGTVTRVRTVPDGLAPGSEVAIPVLLGWTPTAPVDRGAIEASAHAIDIPDGARAWRVDVMGDDDGPADTRAVRRAANALRVGAPIHAVHPLTGHRLLLVGPAPLPDAAAVPYLRVWPEGVALPRILDPGVVVVAARGAGAGVAGLLGAQVVVPDTATGGTDTDLAAKAEAAIEVIAGGIPRVVVHVGGADSAAHARDAAAKVAFLERVDRELLAPLVAALTTAGGTLRVCPDHGCDPQTGTHDAYPVPCVTWTPGDGPLQGATSAPDATSGASAEAPSAASPEDWVNVRDASAEAPDAPSPEEWVNVTGASAEAPATPAAPQAASPGVLTNTADSAVFVSTPSEPDPRDASAEAPSPPRLTERAVADLNVVDVTAVSPVQVNRPAGRGEPGPWVATRPSAVDAAAAGGWPPGPSSVRIGPPGGDSA